MPRLEKWLIRVAGSPYDAPETLTAVLVGDVYDDSRFDDGTTIQTSRIVGLTQTDDGWRGETRSGTVYALGTISDGFAEYMSTNGHTIHDYAQRLA